jgi:hypothetical protein
VREDASEKEVQDRGRGGGERQGRQRQRSSGQRRLRFFADWRPPFNADRRARGCSPEFPPLRFARMRATLAQPELMVPRFRIVQSMPHVLLTAAHGICAGAEAVCRRFRCIRLRAGQRIRGLLSRTGCESRGGGQTPHTGEYRNQGAPYLGGRPVRCMLRHGGHRNSYGSAHPHTLAPRRAAPEMLPPSQWSSFYGVFAHRGGDCGGRELMLRRRMYPKSLAW